jgi:hypothetical protein
MIIRTALADQLETSRVTQKIINDFADRVDKKPPACDASK